jgi:agmatine deiminase
VVADCSKDSHCVPGEADDQIYDAAAEQLTDAGLSVIRWPFAAEISHKGSTFDADYMNWLVGNGFVITVGFDDPEADAAAKAQLEEWFPDRDVHVIEMLDSWVAGGGVHCHTNDQPAWP